MMGLLEEDIRREPLNDRRTRYGGKRKKLSEVEDTVLLEVIKCLRALLNTEVCDLLFRAQSLVTN